MVALRPGESIQKKDIKMFCCGEKTSGEAEMGQEFPYIEANPFSNINQKKI